MKKDLSSLLKQLQDELALVKTSIENNKFTLEPERIELRNRLPTLIDWIKKVKHEMASQK